MNFEEIDQSIEEEDEKENKLDENKVDEVVLWENIQSAIACKIRIDALLAPINSNEILVLGGSDGNQTLSDGFILDISDNSVKKVYKSTNFSFCTAGNTSVTIPFGKNKVAALVEDKFHILHLITWNPTVK